MRIADYDHYLATVRPVQLRDKVTSRGVDPSSQAVNFGESKGRGFDHVVILPTDPMKQWLADPDSKLAAQSRAKFLCCAHPRALQRSYCDGLEIGLAARGLFTLPSASNLILGSHRSREPSYAANATPKSSHRFYTQRKPTIATSRRGSGGCDRWHWSRRRGLSCRIVPDHGLDPFEQWGETGEIDRPGPWPHDPRCEHSFFHTRSRD
ncbi:hypothetical protein ACFSKM_02170 [Ancylobacter dichloromethanicus]